MPSPLSGFVTTTSLAPIEAPSGTVAVIEVSLTKVTSVAETPPIVTVAPSIAKLFPVIVIVYHPANKPLSGLTLVIDSGRFSTVIQASPSQT